MQIRIRTTDATWAAKHGTGIVNGETVITVPDDAVEQVTFAGAAMLRFDIAVVGGGKSPRDWFGSAALVPSRHIVTEGQQRQFCRKRLRSTVPAVTLKFSGNRSLCWCTEHADDAEHYAASSDRQPA